MKWADLTATSRQFSWPPVGSYLTAYGHFSMAADTPMRRDGMEATTSVRTHRADWYIGVLDATASSPRSHKVARRFE